MSVFLDLKKFEIKEESVKRRFYSVYNVLEKATGIVYSSERLKYKIQDSTFYELINFSREVNTISKLNHPSILRFIGYSPVDFNKQPKPMILTELGSNGILEDVIRNRPEILDHTKKMKIIYGIGKSISYLHSHDIIHCDISTSNIVLNNKFEPKLCNFNSSRYLNETSEMTYIGTPRFIARERWLNKEYSKSSDIYSFCLVIYEIMTNDVAYSDIEDIYELSMNIIEGEHPKKLKEIENKYQEIIKLGLKSNPDERPTIKEIIEILRSEDDEEYQEYIEELDNTPTSFDPTKNIFNLDEILKSGIKLRKDDFHWHEYFKEPIDSSHVLKINEYEKQELIGNKNVTDVFKIIERKSGIQFAAKIAQNKLERDDYESIISLSYNVNKMTKINHSAIVKYIGYSPLNFEGEFKPVIVSEYVKNGTLNKLLNLERENNGLKILNGTQRLINIYGIASALNCLHRHGMVMKSLSPSKILEDDFLFPKICDFGRSRFVIDEDSADSYESPENVKLDEVTKEGNVYSFGLIVYEMMMNKKASKNDESNYFVPSFDDSLPICYQKLIERCCSNNSDERPIFGEILTEIKNNPEFITEGVIKEDFQIYTQFIDSNSHELFESYIEKFNGNSKSENFKKITLYEKKEINLVDEPLDLNKFEEINIIDDKVHQINGLVIEKETGNKYYSIKLKDMHEMLCREVNFLCKFDHPCILKLVGYSPVDFKGMPLPMILTELGSNGILEDVIRNRPEILDHTKKMKIIYGIGKSISYLHSHDIIHCDISTSNIVLNNKFEPKLCNFNSSRYLNETSEMTYIGTPRFIARERWLNKEYSKSSDIYSFCLVIYEIMTNDVAYSDIEDIYELSMNIIEGEHPKKLKEIENKYQEIIKLGLKSNPDERPTIKEIIEILRSEDDEEYQEYIEELDNTPTSFDPTKNILEFKGFDNFINKAIQLNSPEIFNPSVYMDKRIDLTHIININDYEKREKLGQATESESFKLIYKKDGGEYVGKTSLDEFRRDDYETIIKLSFDINKLTKMNHASIVQYIGYSPHDFDGDYRPVIITKYVPSYTLERMIQLEKTEEVPKSWNMTKKLMIIYGVVSAMAYLHSNNIIHQSLNTCNVLLDQYLLPRIAGVGTFINRSMTFAQMFNREQHKFVYFAPEFIQTFRGTKANDVYSFAIIVYEMLSGKKVFDEDFSMKTIFKVISGMRPTIPDSIPEVYRNLIQSCWHSDVEARPTFDEIYNTIKNNLDVFITDDMNKEDFLFYMNFVDKNIPFEEIEYYIDLENEMFQKINLSFRKKKRFSFNFEFLDLNKFQKKNLIGEGSFGIVYKVLDIKNKIIFAAKVSKAEINYEIEDDMINISREVSVISKINHPSILKFIGFSPFNFKGQMRPVIVTEYASGGTLQSILDLERNCCSKPGWDITKKLINLYGLASSLQYLHSHDIIHRDLCPSNVLLDDSLYPKLADFGLSKKVTHKNENNQISSGFKGTPAYVAPEIWNFHEYTKAGDVYAFGFTAFEIMTNQVLFPDIKDFYSLYHDVVYYKKRPSFEFPIPLCYKKLITKCWAHEKEMRPTFDEIVYDLENNEEYLTECVDKDEFYEYVDFVTQYRNNIAYEQFKSQVHPRDNNKKAHETHKPAKHVKKEDNVSYGNRQKICEIDENEHKKIDEFENDHFNESNPDFNLIHQYISAKQSDNLIHYLNDHCNFEVTSSIFDKCFQTDPGFYMSLCKEGISLHNAVSLHKYAISLIYDDKNGQISKEKIEKARAYLEESIQLGFDLSYFSLARLLDSYYGERDHAFQVASEGAMKGEKYSKCLLGFFIAKGVGTSKNRREGVSMMLESGADDLYQLFATEIGIYYYELANESQSKSDNENNRFCFEKNAFEWFEKAYLMKKTSASINNYGICFLKGIFVKKDVRKALEIFSEGARRVDPNSMYHLAFLLEQINSQKSLHYYQRAAELGNVDAKRRYLELMSENISEGSYHLTSQSIFDFVDDERNYEFAVKNNDDMIIEMESNTASQISVENDTENNYEYMMILIQKGNIKIPLEHAISLYNSKFYGDAFIYFSALSKINHPIAKYFIGVMKFRGYGCEKNKDEAYKILNELSTKGIDRAREFIDDNF